ncbi:hypothetical protein E3N88_43792 [Mikania micrantha]|uniref:Uncharacterized protein n=1 Tax=Mikania micrantha TaxID=192012 RepID=A0A5N6LE22_9ASTR|nr:hypothetical protein E3N88_43792 [Mikania micrantha]
MGTVKRIEVFDDGYKPDLTNCIEGIEIGGGSCYELLQSDMLPLKIGTEFEGFDFGSNTEKIDQDDVVSNCYASLIYEEKWSMLRKLEICDVNPLLRIMMTGKDSTKFIDDTQASPSLLPLPLP